MVARYSDFRVCHSRYQTTGVVFAACRTCDFKVTGTTRSVVRQVTAHVCGDRDHRVVTSRVQTKMTWGRQWDNLDRVWKPVVR